MERKSSLLKPTQIETTSLYEACIRENIPMFLVSETLRYEISDDTYTSHHIDTVRVPTNSPTQLVTNQPITTQSNPTKNNIIIEHNNNKIKNITEKIKNIVSEIELNQQLLKSSNCQIPKELSNIKGLNNIINSVDQKQRTAKIEELINKQKLEVEFYINTINTLKDENENLKSTAQYEQYEQPIQQQPVQQNRILDGDEILYSYMMDNIHDETNEKFNF